MIDLLAIGLASSPDKTASMEKAAREIVSTREPLARLAMLDPETLRERGMDPFEATRCLAWFELGKKAASPRAYEKPLVDDPGAVAALLADLKDERQEHFVVLLLDAQNRVTRRSDVHKGTLTSAPVGAREVFREAIREGASSVIVAHNHPSGDPTPSPEDIDVTRGLVQIGAMLDIPVLDHVIVGSEGYVSMKRKGLM